MYVLRPLTRPSRCAPRVSRALSRAGTSRSAPNISWCVPLPLAVSSQIAVFFRTASFYHLVCSFATSSFFASSGTAITMRGVAGIVEGGYIKIGAEYLLVLSRNISKRSKDIYLLAKALTALYVPYSLDTGCNRGTARPAPSIFWCVPSPLVVTFQLLASFDLFLMAPPRLEEFKLKCGKDCKLLQVTSVMARMHRNPKPETRNL